MLRLEKRPPAMRASVMSLASAIILSGAVAASPLPTPIFDVFGITTEEVGHYPYSKSECLKWDEDRVFCPTGLKIGNVRTESITFMYTEGRLSEVRGQAPFSEYALMIDTLELKYGPSKILDGIHTWRFKGGALIARKIDAIFSNGLMGCEFLFISTDNSVVSSREPMVNF